MKYCSSCRNGEKKEPAAYLVRGKVFSLLNNRWIPYRAYLCEDHLSMMLDDGIDLEIVRYYGEARAQRADELTREYTGYNSFRELCQDTPTLRFDCFEGKQRNEVCELRRYYFEATGRKAYS